MKFKVIANGTLIEENVTSLKALNIVCVIMQTILPGEHIEIKVYYLDKNNIWQLENSFNVN